MTTAKFPLPPSLVIRYDSTDDLLMLNSVNLLHNVHEFDIFIDQDDCNFEPCGHCKTSPPPWYRDTQTLYLVLLTRRTKMENRYNGMISKRLVIVKAMTSLPIRRYTTFLDYCLYRKKYILPIVFLWTNPFALMAKAELVLMNSHALSNKTHHQL